MMSEIFFKKYWYIGLLILILVHLFLLSKLTFFPYPELFVYSYLTKAGLIPYQQIFDQHFPGLVFFPLNLAVLGIDSVFEYRILQLAVVTITQVALFLTARKLFKSNKLAFLANIFYLIWQPFFEGNVLWIDSFVPALLLGAFYFLYKTQGKKELFFGGVLLGISLLLKQVAGPLIIVIGFYLLYQKRSIKKVLPFALGVLIPVAYLLFWVTNLGVWSDFWYWTVTFNLTTFAQMGKTVPSIGQLVRITPVFGLAMMGMVLLLLARERRKESFILLSLFFIGSLLFAYARFDYVHLQPALPFAILILIAAFGIVQKRARIQALGLYFVVALFLLIPFFKTNWGNSVRFNGQFEKELSERVLDYVNPGDSVFALGTTPHIYYLTQTLPPGLVFVFQFPWFMREAEGKVLNGIQSDPPKVIIRDITAEVSNMKLIDYMPKINSYIEENYKVVDYVDGVEILIPKL